MTVTFEQVLTARLRQRPGQPLVTFYDGASGERTELSVTSYANWVAKLATLLTEECDLARGDRLRVDLPTHWLAPIALGACWLAGIQVVSNGPADAVICGPDTLTDWADHPSPPLVLATALHPLGQRFADGVPAGVLDLGVEIWSQPDTFIAVDPAQPDDLAFDHLTHAQLWVADPASNMDQAAAPGSGETGSSRLLCQENPALPEGLFSFTRALTSGGSVVLVSHGSAEQIASIRHAEKISAEPQPPTRS